MAVFRSQSCRDGRMQREMFYGDNTTPTGMQDLRSYSVSHVGSVQPHNLGKEMTMKKGKSNLGSSSKSWILSDPELQRKKRVAGYKVYTVEGKMKGSLRKSFRWIKNTCTQLVYGLWEESRSSNCMMTSGSFRRVVSEFLSSDPSSPAGLGS